MKPMVISVAVGVALLSMPAGAGAQASAKPAPTSVPVRTLYDHPALQKKVSLTLKDADINKAVEELAKAAQVSLIVERPATLKLSPVSVALTDARLADVLDALSRLYGYRWTRRGEVFLLTIVPPSTGINTMQDIQKAARDAAKDIFDHVLNPEQKAKMADQGYLPGKDLTPGQQGVIWGHVMDILGSMQSGLLTNGVFIADPEKGSFAISPVPPPARP